MALRRIMSASRAVIKPVAASTSAVNLIRRALNDPCRLFKRVLISAFRSAFTRRSARNSASLVVQDNSHQLPYSVCRECRSVLPTSAGQPCFHRRCIVQRRMRDGRPASALRGCCCCPTAAFCITAEVVGRRQSGDGIRRFADCGRTKGAGNHVTLLRRRGGGFTVRFPDAARLQIAAEADTGKRFDHGDRSLALP